MPLGVAFRMFVIGALAVAASGYAVVRHYFFRPPLVVEPADSGVDPNLVPAPELVPLPDDEARPH